MLNTLEIETSLDGLRDLRWNTFNVLFGYYARHEGIHHLAHLVMLNQDGTLLVEGGAPYSAPREQPPLTRQATREAMFAIRDHFAAVPNTIVWRVPNLVMNLQRLTGERNWLTYTTWYDLSAIMMNAYHWDTYVNIDQARRRLTIPRPNQQSGDRTHHHDAFGYAHSVLHLAHVIMTKRTIA